ncbi:MAG: acetylglutamate kinase [Bacteroidales bacterium]|jgi:acetylglutamate kinase|nr:acetylglutamate kinase [Bacteroidales bacterium]
MISLYKIGGNVVDDPQALERFCAEFAALPGPKVLVHGGGVRASQVQKALGQEPVKIEGRRVTDAAALEVVTMVYAGWCNKDIVARLQAHGCNAVGLSGCDGAAVTARRRPPKTLSDGVTQVDFGFVGDVTPESVNVPFLELLLDAGMTPVLCAINHDGAGQLLNTNADTVAASISVALGAKLFYCFEKNGVLCTPEDDSSVIPSLDPAGYARLKAEGRVADGMIPKLDNAFRALQDGACGVVIRNASRLSEPGGTELKI